MFLAYAKPCCMMLLVLVCGFARASSSAVRPLLPHEAKLLNLAAAPGGVRVLVTLRTAVDTTAHGPLAEQDRRNAIADARAAFAADVSGFNVRSIRRYESFPIMLVNVDQAALLHILDLTSVSGVQSDQANRPQDNTNDSVMNVPTAWAAGFSGADEVVAVLDTGVQEIHPFLSMNGTSTARAVAELEGCFSGVGGTVTAVTSLCPGGVYSETGDPNGHLDGTNCDVAIPGCEHGTHVAGIAAGSGSYNGGNNENGVAVAANLMPIQVFSCSDSGNGVCMLEAFDSDIIAALDWVHDRAVNSQYRIAAANLSLGVSGSHYTADCDAEATAYKAAIDTLRNVDSIPTVISAGNDGFTDGVDYPACISSAISVAATDNTDMVAPYTNTAPFVSMYAPGTDVYSSVPISAYDFMGGTSMAAPQVAGAIAILQSKFGHQATVTQLLTLLQNTGKPISAYGYTRPRVDIGAAVDDIFVACFDD